MRLNHARWLGAVLAVACLVSGMPSFAAETYGQGPPPPSQWGRNNLHLIDRDSRTGFEIYRTSKPTRADMRKFCKLGITEMMVLSGTAGEREFKYASECPTLKVIYNQKQMDNIPVTVEFLTQFDQWVELSRIQGKKIAFRCECGCHRTGRLAAYYQMKYQFLPVDDALAIMTEHGQWMLFFPHLYKQVRAMNDFISGQPCGQKRKYCVRDETP